jgi:hypothetical protein
MFKKEIKTQQKKLIKAKSIVKLKKWYKKKYIINYRQKILSKMKFNRKTRPKEIVHYKSKNRLKMVNKSIKKACKMCVEIKKLTAILITLNNK